MVLKIRIHIRYVKIRWHYHSHASAIGWSATKSIYPDIESAIKYDIHFSNSNSIIGFIILSSFVGAMPDVLIQ
jgi:hypothetical protein